MARVTVKNGHPKSTRDDEIGVCAQRVDTILGLIVNTVGKAYVMWKREGEFQTLISYYLCILTLVLKLEVTIFLICNCFLDEIIPDLIHRSMLSLELDVPTTAPHTGCF